MTIDLEPPADYEPGLFERTPPHDLVAEMSALRACFFDRDVCKAVVTNLDPADMYKPAHETILNGITEMYALGQTIDPITLGKFLSERGDLQRAGGATYLFEITSRTMPISHPDHALDYVEIIQGHARRRELIKHHAAGLQDAYGMNGPTGELLERTIAAARDIRDRGQTGNDLPVEDILDFVQHEDTYDWVVPGLLERQDRLILTASEGGGKSTLLRQMSVTLAAGIHPFKTWELIDPVRVLTLDCENSAASSRRKFRPLLAAADGLEQSVRRGMFHIECRPQGLDLTRSKDRAWMMRRVERINPDVLIIGPVYRLHAGNPNDEELARKVSVVIDDARATAGCAVLMEAHAPHGNGLGPRSLRPLGSSLWMRWPEFGFGLRPVEDEKSAQNTEGARGRRVVPWRGMRDERDWPHFIKQGEKWPWISYKPIDADQFTGYSPTGAIW
ncbi:AAA family ATPase [Streptomyces sp. NPDC051310]|uniref:AAA family ATPase n=1 Tax=Streptomyces sp. NPDC051310 TaxID=3365649 RepID=UPI00378BCD3F